MLLHGSMHLSEMEDISKNSIRMRQSIGIDVDLSHLHVIEFENIVH